MRGGFAAFTTPVQVEGKVANRGDGDTYALAETLYGNVTHTRSIRQSTQGGTIVDPIRVDFPHDTDVKVGDRLTVDGDQGTVQTAGVVRGAFGVPHHLHVEAI